MIKTSTHFILLICISTLLLSCDKDDSPIPQQNLLLKTMIEEGVILGSEYYYAHEFEYYDDNKLKSETIHDVPLEGWNRWDYVYSGDTLFRYYSHYYPSNPDTTSNVTMFISLSENSYNYYTQSGTIHYVEIAGNDPCGFSQNTSYEGSVIILDEQCEYLDENCSYTITKTHPVVASYTYIKDDKNSWEQNLNFGYGDYHGGNTIEYSRLDEDGILVIHRTYNYEYNYHDYPVSMIVTEMNGHESFFTFEYY